MVVVCKPLIWNRFIQVREFSCDDLTIEVIKDELVLASALVDVRRLSLQLPAHRWQLGLPLTQTFLPSETCFERRVQRLLDYKRPRMKFLIGKAMRVAAMAIILFTGIFLWQFHTSHQTSTMTQEYQSIIQCSLTSR